VDIDILCKVVDNFGDIGVVYRLARCLAEREDPPRLRLVVDNLAAFAAMDGAVDPAAAVQDVHGWELFSWAAGDTRGEAGEAVRSAFRARRPRLVLECFACGRPDWLEDILFGPEAEPSLIVDVEHLTAEPYAADLHRMPSLTRSSLARKALFLPGFSPGTGGLLMDRAFAAALERAREEDGRRALRRRLLGLLGSAGTGPGAAEEGFWVCVFSYERDYSRIVADLEAFGGDRPILALVAAGKSQACFRRAWEARGSPFPASFLPFLPQEDWDAALAASDFSIVRGEDSWSRAALAGRPFLWQAYPQEGAHQLIKVEAFLALLKPFFGAEDFAPLAAAYRAFNERGKDSPDERGLESIGPILASRGSLEGGFRDFSRSLSAPGDLAANLMTFLREML